MPEKKAKNKKCLIDTKIPPATHSIKSYNPKSLPKNLSSEMKPKKLQQKRKIRGPRKANEEKRSEVKQKKKVETCDCTLCHF